MLDRWIDRLAGSRASGEERGARREAEEKRGEERRGWRVLRLRVRLGVGFPLAGTILRFRPWSCVTSDRGEPDGSLEGELWKFGPEIWSAQFETDEKFQQLALVGPL